MSETIISIKNLKKSFGKIEVLNDITIDIQSGEIYGLIGRSGAGKSTLLRCINGLTDFQKGQLIVDGRDMASLSKKDLRYLRKDIGMVFQNFSLISRKTVYENIALPMKLWNYSEKEIEEKVKKLAGIVEIEEKLDSYPSQLSGGQRQRVGIARALTLDPKILLSDEATSALDPLTTKAILELLKKINVELGITIIVVTHEIEVIKRICHRTAILEKGELVVKAPTNELFVEEPIALQNLMGSASSYDSDEKHCLVKLKIYDYDKNERLLFEIGHEKNIEFALKESQIESISGVKSGYLIIEVDQSDIDSLKDVLEKYSIEMEVI